MSGTGENRDVMKKFLLAAAIALLPSQAFPQTPVSRPVPPATVEPGVATRTGNEVNVSVDNYNYIEPGTLRISIHAPKIGVEFISTAPLNEDHHWFAQTDLRATFGNAAYDGFCLPWLITPNSASPNGYELDLGDASPCNETGDKDWYLEGRVLAGKDLIGHKWGLSPYGGVGLRYLSNGTAGVSGFRTDRYLYPAIGLAARTNAGGHRVLSFTLEYDRLIHGWQKTRNSLLGGGVIPATPTAPSFTLNGITDISFVQHGGWALRASAKYDVARHLSVEPYYFHWSVNASPDNDQTVTFTVNGVTAHEQFGAYEPFNVTHEVGVKLGFHF